MTQLAIQRRIIPPGQVSVGYIGGGTLEAVSLYYLLNLNYRNDFALTPPVFYDDRPKISETIDYMLSHIPPIGVALVSASNNHLKDALNSVAELVKIKESGRHLGMVGIYQSHPLPDPIIESEFEKAGANAAVQIDDYSSQTLSTSLENMVLAIQAANNGNYFMSPQLKSYSGVDFTNQQREIGNLLVLGKTNKQIGIALNLSDKTVKNYVSTMIAKLGVRRRSNLAVFFATGKIILDDELQ